MWNSAYGTIFTAIAAETNQFMIEAIAYRTGSPYPLGATWDGQGVNFAIYSENAKGVELCLFNAIEDDIETFKIRLKERSHHVWHAYLTA